jgi:hypothetical protein
LQFANVRRGSMEALPVVFRLDTTRVVPLRERKLSNILIEPATWRHPNARGFQPTLDLDRCVACSTK